MDDGNSCPAAAPDDQEPSGKLRVELDTRITSQRLHYRSGNEETSAASVRTLFPTVRELLSTYWKAKAFRWLAARLLNETLRPYTDRWQGWEVDGKFPDEQTRRTFRAEVQLLQKQLECYRLALAALEEGRTPDANIFKAPPGREPAPAPAKPSVCLGTRQLATGIGDQISFAGKLMPNQINHVERQEILARRRILGLPNPPGSKDVLENASGLAFSGGGIRSATFCLGVVQVLVRKGIFEQFDYMSTVSGGGYLGSFLSCALGTEPESKKPAPDAANKPKTAAEKSGAVVPETKPKASEASKPAGIADPLKTEAAATARMDAEAAAAARAKIEDAFEFTRHRESGLIRHLRNNSKYLLNGGLAARFEMAGLVLSGIVSNLMILLPIPMVAALVVILADERWHFWGDAMHGPVQWKPGVADAAGLILIGMAGILVGFWIFLPLVQLLNHGKRPGSKGAAFRRSWEITTVVMATLTVVSGAVFLLPALFHGYAWLWDRLPRWLQHSPVALPSLSGIGTILLGVLTTLIKQHRAWLRAIVAKLFILSGPVFFLSILLGVGKHLGLGLPPTPYSDPDWLKRLEIVLLATAGLLLWGWIFVNINTLAPHRYYRARLCECYLARRVTTDKTRPARLGLLRRAAGEWSQGRTAALRYLPLSGLGATHAVPYHLINTTVNLPASDNKELRGREGDFFVVSKYFCGSPIVGYAPTLSVEKTDPHFDLGTAMAVSGAAASTNMGWQTLPHFRFLMTLFNVRLGYWLRWPPENALHRFLASPGPWYLLRELSGQADEHCRFLNLSDGGHIENLGVYELLRRKCKFIVCVDAGMEPKMECADLMRLQRYAAIDLGIQMEIRVSDLELVNGLTRAYAVLVLIDYAPPMNEGDANRREWAKAELGWMLYLKLAVTGVEPGYVLDYRRENPDFPHQSTADQIYDEAQFEAYRQLGECAMDSLFREELMGDQPPKTIEAWFQKLADNLLPDNHPLFRATPASAPEK